MLMDAKVLSFINKFDFDLLRKGSGLGVILGVHCEKCVNGMITDMIPERASRTLGRIVLSKDCMKDFLPRQVIW
jgi:hypothetical protein